MYNLVDDCISKKEDEDMKKILGLCLTFCMILVASTSVYAAEAKPTSEGRLEEVKEAANAENSARNIDYWNTHGPLVISDSSFKVTPGAGENLKIHLYVTKGPVTIKIRAQGSSGYTTIATWNSTGHHWADLVTGTDGGYYWVNIVGPCIVDGGVYSEP